MAFSAQSEPTLTLTPLILLSVGVSGQAGTYPNFATRPTNCDGYSRTDDLTCVQVAQPWNVHGSAAVPELWNRSHVADMPPPPPPSSLPVSSAVQACVAPKVLTLTATTQSFQDFSFVESAQRAQARQSVLRPHKSFGHFFPILIAFRLEHYSAADFSLSIDVVVSPVIAPVGF